MAGVWLKLSYAEVVGCFADPSLSVSKEASSIMRDRGDRPPSLPLVSVLAQTRPDQYGSRTYDVSPKEEANHRPSTVPHNSSRSLEAVNTRHGKYIVIIVMPYLHVTVTRTRL